MNTNRESTAACGESRRRVHKPPEVRRREILSAAARVFASNGYRHTDMQEVADLAGVGKGTVYRHFPTKRELFLAALEQNLDRLAEFVESARDRHDNPLDALKSTVHAYLVFFDEHPETIELFVQERAEFSTADKPLYFVRSEQYQPDWVDMFAALGDQLASRHRGLTMEPEHAMEILGFLLYGAVMSNRLGSKTDRLSAHSEDIINTFLHGVIHETQ